MPDFNWSAKSERAAELIAEAALTLSAIAEELDISRVTLYMWRQHDEFKARIETLLSEWRAEVRRRGIANLEKRVEVLNDQHDSMRKLIADRSVSPEMVGVPGGGTGLIVQDIKGIGKGKDFKEVKVYKFDAALLREIREHQKQVAMELGQWTENAAVNVTGLDAAGKPDEAQALLAAARQLRANAKRSGDGPEHEADRG